MSEQLTPDERDAMRARILGGAKGIKPVGAHRNAWIAGSVAAALVVAIAGGAAATWTLTGPPVTTTPSPTATAPPTPTPTPTPIPTSTPTPPPTSTGPVIAFGGDCAAVLTDAEAQRLVPGAAVESRSSRLIGNSAGDDEMIALLGGLRCTWTSPENGFAVSIYPRSAVAERPAVDWAEMRCEMSIVYCQRGFTVDEFWVGVSIGLPPLNQDPAGEELNRLSAQAESIVEALRPKLDAAVASPAPGLPAAPLPECPTWTSTVVDWAGVEPEVGFPGDSIPTGIDWDVSVAAGLARWCAWYHFPDEGVQPPTVVEFMVQSYLGAPGGDAIAESGLSANSVPGTSAAWLWVSPNGGPPPIIVAVVGDTRLTVSGRRSVGGGLEDLVAALAASISVPG